VDAKVFFRRNLSISTQTAAMPCGCHNPLGGNLLSTFSTLVLRVKTPDHFGLCDGDTFRFENEGEWWLLGLFGLHETVYSVFNTFGLPNISLFFFPCALTPHGLAPM
jgi:hypothetical protein